MTDEILEEENPVGEDPVGENPVEETPVEEPFVAQGVTFDGKHSYTDFGMWISKQRPDKGSPQPKLSTFNVPGADGILDLTEANTGTVKFSNRTMVLTFVAKIDSANQPSFEASVMGALHGKYIERIIFDNDPSWYYSGRATVRFTDRKSWKLKIIVTIDAAPYAMKTVETVRSLVPSANEYVLQPVPVGQDASTPHTYAGGVKIYNDTTVDHIVGVAYEQLGESLIVGFLRPGKSMQPESAQYIEVRGSEAAGQTTPVYKIMRSLWDIRQGDAAHHYYIYIPLADIEDGALPGGGTTDAVQADDISKVFVSGLYRCEVFAEEKVGKIVVVNASRKDVIPTFETNRFWVHFTFDGKKYEFPNGTKVFPDIVLHQGENVFYIEDEFDEGETFTIRFREGRL